jgi:hypothetical protein
MTERVVDGLEAVEVDEHHRHLRLEPPRPHQRVRQPVAEQRPVAQAGQVIMLGEFGEPFAVEPEGRLRRTQVRDVLRQREAGPDRSVAFDHRLADHAEGPARGGRVLDLPALPS